MGVEKRVGEEVQEFEGEVAGVAEAGAEALPCEWGL